MGVVGEAGDGVQLLALNLFIKAGAFSARFAFETQQVHLTREVKCCRGR